MLAAFFQLIGACVCLLVLGSTMVELGRRASEHMALVRETHKTLNQLVESFTDEILIKRLPPDPTEVARWRIEAERELAELRAEVALHGCGDPDCERCYSQDDWD